MGNKLDQQILSAIDSASPRGRISVPRTYLWPTQKPCEFRNTSDKRITQEIRATNGEYLNENPIKVVSLEVKIENGGMITLLAILDGHHRARSSGRFKISTVPSMIFSIHDLLSQMDPQYQTADTVDAIYLDAIEAAKCFEALMREHGKDHRFSPLPAQWVSADNFIKSVERRPKAVERYLWIQSLLSYRVRH